ncbi:hypothetical protein [Clostridium sp.]|uniref:hypothetical protein n=1 Tax=Clostridium sp. TaxID=1506 RepID=UPI002915A04C|nr:hypothetical protein [Clostridium sp.]MDU5108036.1 hypothetical protein [Clostridium sp.]
MKDNKLNLLIFIYSGQLTKIAYYIAVLIILIPISIVLIRDTPFNESFSKIVIGISGSFIIIGKLFVIINKKKENKNISIDSGILTGIIISLMVYLFN